MELQQIVHVLRRRLWIIVLATVLAAAVVFLISVNMAPVYQATVILMVNQSTNMPFAEHLPLATGEDLAMTYSELLKSRPLLETVIANLDLDISPSDLKEKRIRTSLVPDTQLLQVTVEDSDAQRASAIANELALMFIALRNTEQQLQDIVALEDGIVDQMSSLKQAISQGQARTSMAASESEKQMAATALSGQQQAYAQLLAAYLNVRLLQAELLDITVVEPAIPPAKPIRPNPAFYTFLGGWIGLALGVGVAFLIEHLDRSFKTREDIGLVLPLSALATVPRGRAQGILDDQSLITVGMPLSPAAEAYRTLRTNIRFASVDKPLKTLLITSAEPQAGKTTVVANLGVVCAHAGLNVVIIDADLRRPTLDKRFGTAISDGLTELLVKHTKDLDRALSPTGITNLRLIGSGQIPPNPSELLASKSMQIILDDARELADLVIVDTPPALAVTDAAVLASKVDGVLLVIEAGRTSHEAARGAYENLRHVGANVIGAVLTKAVAGHAAYYYAEEGGRDRSVNWRRAWAASLAFLRTRVTPLFDRSAKARGEAERMGGDVQTRQV